MWPGRIAFAFVALWCAAALAIAALIFVNAYRIDSAERYPALLLGLAMLYMGGRLLVGLIWPAKPKDPNAPIEVPPLEQVRGRTSYRDGSMMERNVMAAVGVIFLGVSLGAADESPIVLVIALISVGILAGAGVMTWRRMQYGRARLQLEVPARRGDVMRGVITTSGSAWAAAGHGLDATVDVRVHRVFKSGKGSSRSVEIANALAEASVVRDGNDITVRFHTTIPLIDTSDGRFSWNVQLETVEPDYRATFLIDVA